MHLLIVLNKPN